MNKVFQRFHKNSQFKNQNFRKKMSYKDWNILDILFFLMSRNFSLIVQVAIGSRTKLLKVRIR